jgi:hypothetical protein
MISRMRRSRMLFDPEVKRRQLEGSHYDYRIGMID